MNSDHWRAVLIACVGLGLGLTEAGAQAQSKPSACVAELKKAYGATKALRSECHGETDCSFQAPVGNASALALIGTMVKRTQDCYAAAGLEVTKEIRSADGTVRYYGASGAAERCTLLVATSAAEVAEGMRAVCQPVK